MGSLIVDEMSIKPQLRYVKYLDKYVGTADNQAVEDLGVQAKLANRLLCFLLSGLSTRIHIPVAYYFTRQLQGRELQQLMLRVLAETEKAGFKIIRVVADNSSVNTLMMTELGSGHLQPQIPHPNNPNRPLFLSFDYCHIIKNVRNQFVDANKQLTNDEKPITSEPLKKLYHRHKNDVIKPIRFLTRKHLYPNNLEKMNVKRAVQIFSPEVIAALKTMEKYGTDPAFPELYKTIEFLENFSKWFQFHDVSSNTQHIYTRDPNTQQFFSSSDERLNWLEKDFLRYLQNWRNSCKKHQVREQFLSLETYEAICITTFSTVQCVRYLLHEGFHFVLTRKFSSDNLEAFFSTIRQMTGGNDQGNAVSVIQSLEKILKIGIVGASTSANVVSSSPVRQLFPSHPHA